MRHAFFCNVPGHGHINPSLPVVAELSRRGHLITYFASPAYRSAIAATGAAFQAYTTVPDDYFDARGLHGGVASRVSASKHIASARRYAARAAQHAPRTRSRRSSDGAHRNWPEHAQTGFGMSQ